MYWESFDQVERGQRLGGGGLVAIREPGPRRPGRWPPRERGSTVFADEERRQRHEAQVDRPEVLADDRVPSTSEPRSGPRVEQAAVPSARRVKTWAARSDIPGERTSFARGNRGRDNLSPRPCRPRDGTSPPAQALSPAPDARRLVSARLVAAAAVALQLPVDGAGGDTQRGGRPCVLSPPVWRSVSWSTRRSTSSSGVPMGMTTWPAAPARTLADGLRQVGDVEHLAAGEDHRPLHRVLQLAHVARPGVVLEGDHRLRG